MVECSACRRRSPELRTTCWACGQWLGTLPGMEMHLVRVPEDPDPSEVGAEHQADPSMPAPAEPCSEAPGYP